jgi:hypothetical protein
MSWNRAVLALEISSDGQIGMAQAKSAVLKVQAPSLRSFDEGHAL